MMLFKCEAGEVTDRIYQREDGKWYYRMRGNQVIGPFDNRLTAERALHKQLRACGALPSPKSAWAKQLISSRLLRRSATRHS